MLMLIACANDPGTKHSLLTDSEDVADSDTGEIVDSQDSPSDSEDSPTETGDSPTDTEPPARFGPEDVATAKVTGDAVGAGSSAAGPGPTTVASLCDVDGDGVGDLIVGFPGTTGSGGGGAVYAFAGPVTGTRSVTEAPAQWYGDGAEGDGAGHTVDCAGDVDRDGYDDLVVGAPVFNYASNPDEAAGQAYIVRGPFTSSSSLSSAAAVIDGGDAGRKFGASVAGVGDIDGDGVPDIVVATELGNQAFLLPGNVEGIVTADIDATATIGDGVDGMFADVVRRAGDLDGDGMDDLLLTGNENLPAFYLLAPISGSIGLDDADGGFAYTDPSTHGVYPRAGGDVDGDGHRDVMLGDYDNSTHGDQTGVVFVEAGPFSGVRALESATVAILGKDEVDKVGMGSFIPDLDGDGADELSVSAPHRAGVGEIPEVAIFHGGIAGIFDYDQGDIIIAPPTEESYLGGRMEGTPDLDGDGVPDLLVSDHLDADGGKSAGAMWLFSGANLR